MNIQQLLTDHNIKHITEGQHTTVGWINIHCPFCAGSQNYHLGISQEHGGGHCWRCGGHSLFSVLSKILGLPNAEIRRIIDKYQGISGQKKTAVEPKTAPKVILHPFKFPKPNQPLTDRYKAYLSDRGFDPDKLERDWKLSQTGSISLLDGVSYSHRILIPIFWDGRIVSFQARDVTDTSTRKYLACPKRRERIHHKDILYGRQEYWSNAKAIIVVEGVTDVWRFGFCAAATFGIEFKMEQVLQLLKLHDRFFIVFDDEPQAQEQARRLSLQIKAKTRGMRVHVEMVKGDPGGMKQDDADHFVRQLIGRGRNRESVSL